MDNTIYYRGDTIELYFQLYKNTELKELWDLTDCEIRFQLNNKLSSLKKANVKVSGGSDDQISFIDSILGKFIVTITKEESKLLEVGTYQYELEITTSEGKRFTVKKDTLVIVLDIINWENI